MSSAPNATPAPTDPHGSAVAHLMWWFEHALDGIISTHNLSMTPFHKRKEGERHDPEFTAICSVPSAPDAEEEAGSTLRGEALARRIAKRDIDGRSCYYCVSALDREKVTARKNEGTWKSGRGKDTVAWSMGLHLDIDFKMLRIGRNILLDRIHNQLEVQPSRIVSTGGGIHCYWKFKEPVDLSETGNIEKVEALLKKLAAITGGDFAPAHVAALMRLPGTHNYKNSPPHLVVDIEVHPTREYDVDELADWLHLAPPILSDEEVIRPVKPVRLATTGGQAITSMPDGSPLNLSDPWQKWLSENYAAMHMGTLDLDAMLATMVHGDLHANIRNATASLASQGWEHTEIINHIMDRFEAWVAVNGQPVGREGTSWQLQEEKKISNLIDSWHKKMGAEKVAAAKRRRREQVRAGEEREAQERALAALKAVVDAPAALAAQPAPVVVQAAPVAAQPVGQAATLVAIPAAINDNVIELEQARAAGGGSRPRDSFGGMKAQTGGGGESGNPNDEGLAANGQNSHLKLTEFCVAHINNVQKVIFTFYLNELWLYDMATGTWAKYNGKLENEHLTMMVETALVDYDKTNLAAFNADGARGKRPGEVARTPKMRGAIVAQIRATKDLKMTAEWDAHKLVPMANGLLDLKTRKLRPYWPRDYATYRFAVPYEPEARSINLVPALMAMFERDGPETCLANIKVLQEFFYVALFCTGRKMGRELRRAFFLVGGTKTGKSTIVKLLIALIGQKFCGGPNLEQIADKSEGRFTFQSLRNKMLWAVTEGGNDRTRVPTTKLKAFWAEESVQIDVKQGEPKDFTLLASTIMASNSLPRPDDKGPGFMERILVIRFNQYFDPANRTGVAALAHSHSAGMSVEQFLFETEAAGIANWALEARERVEASRMFSMPPASMKEQQDIEDETNPVAVFCRTCLITIPRTQMVRSMDIYEAYRQWVVSETGSMQYATRPKGFWACVNNYFDLQRGSVPQEIARTSDYSTAIVGVALNEAGLIFWNQACDARNNPTGPHTKFSIGKLSLHSGDLVSYLAGPMLARTMAHFNTTVAKERAEKLVAGEHSDTLPEALRLPDFAKEGGFPKSRF